MNCDGVRNLLSAYLDGELSAGELLRVEEHLRRCHCCADEVDSLRQTIALVASLEEVDLPSSFQVQLRQRLVALGPPVAAVRRASVAPSWQRNVRRWAMPAAAAAAVVAISLTALSPGDVNIIGTGTAEHKLLPAEKPVEVANNNHGNTSQVAPSEGKDTPSGDSEPSAGTPDNRDNPAVVVAPAEPGLKEGGPIQGVTHGDKPVAPPASARTYIQRRVVFAGLVSDPAKAKAISEITVNQTDTGIGIDLRVPSVVLDQSVTVVQSLWPESKPSVIEVDLTPQIQYEEDRLKAN
ncbi:MAG TPA: anti-sigma factor, partial [Symbiobacteriaceae bacterium]|nr:anti-sigma factor [Symbiobacteriaceae bacterium]